MFLGMQDFDFTQTQSNLPKFSSKNLLGNVFASFASPAPAALQ